MMAAQQAGADHVIARLKHGYDTILGKWFKGGEELSVGEWQKVALSRVFLRDAQIIVLDEPTSSMDAQAEYDLFTRFHQLTAGRTVILISHRLSTVKMAKCIYVLEDGKIVESGTHDDLMHGDGTIPPFGTRDGILLWHLVGQRRGLVYWYHLQRGRCSAPALKSCHLWQQG
jgi:ATP-binding cassette subfamily B protein